VKLLSRRAHGIIDYLLVVVFLILPTVGGFSGTPRVLSYSLAFAHLLVTGFTSFPPGAFPFIPARVHGYVEIVVGLLLLVSPRLLGFAQVSVARNSFVAIGAILIGLYAISNYDRREKVAERPPGDRRRWRARKN